MARTADTSSNTATQRTPITYTTGISDSAKHLITCLLRVDPRQRYTAPQVLAHPFVATNMASDDDRREPVIEGACDCCWWFCSRSCFVCLFVLFVCLLLRDFFCVLCSPPFSCSLKMNSHFFFWPSPSTELLKHFPSKDRWKNAVEKLTNVARKLGVHRSS